MTDPAETQRTGATRSSQARLRKRHAAERRFRAYGRVAVVLALGFLAFLLVSIVARGYGAFTATEIELEIHFDRQILDPGNTGDPANWHAADYRPLVAAALRARFPSVTAPREFRRLLGLVSAGAGYDVRDMVTGDPGLIGARKAVWLIASSDIDMLAKGHISRTVPAAERRIDDRQLTWFDDLEAEGAVRRRFNWRLLSAGDSREPERAGIWGAIVGSFYTMVVTLLIAFPFGVMTATYLEEFAPKKRWVDFIEVNINNLAAVPSIVFGLLGLALFLNVFHLPRSAPLVGGLTLALMTLPTIIIVTRISMAAVPPSIREAAMGIGASPVQVVTHHVLPLALPGILTGTIIGMARALGETAPLLMIGMVAFIVDVPASPMDPATALPVQVYLWADSPERAFVEKTAAATMVLLAFLIAMNGLAVYLRKRFERRW
jgi:phosphate transport system permease protein